MKSRGTEYDRKTGLHHKKTALILEHNSNYCNLVLWIVIVVTCFSLLEDTVKRQRFAYFGCVPVSIEEKRIKKIKQINSDKKEAFQMLLDVCIQQNECKILKEQLQKEIDYLQNLISFNDGTTKTLLEWHGEKQVFQLEVGSLLSFFNFVNFFPTHAGRLMQHQGCH